MQFGKKNGTIARIWRCVTLAANSEQYLEYLNRTVIPACRAAEGNEGLLVMKDCQGELTCFLLVSFWASDEALAKFTGTDAETVDPAPEERSLLIAFESTAVQYKVVRALNESPIDLQESGACGEFPLAGLD